jgi:hypothetical protein
MVVMVMVIVILIIATMVVRSNYGPTYLLHVIRYVVGVRPLGDHPGTTLTRHGFDRQLFLIIIVVGFPPLDVLSGLGSHNASQILFSDFFGPV